MKRNILTLIVGVLLLVIFFLLLFVFQVRTSEVKVVTRFNAPVREVTTPGPHLKWPWPIENVFRFDKRIQSFESDKLDESPTRDSFMMLVQVYVGWRIDDPLTFFRNFRDGSITAAENQLLGAVRTAKAGVVGKHMFSDLINTDPNQLKFDAIEQEIRENLQAQVRTNHYGVEIVFLGIKRLGLPESVTTKVFDSMKAERATLAARIQADGLRIASDVKSGADRRAADLLADANLEATTIRAAGEAAAAKYLEVFRQNPALAEFLFELDALEPALKGRTSLILDPQTPPFSLFRGIVATNAPAPSRP